MFKIPQTHKHNGASTGRRKLTDFQEKKRGGGVKKCERLTAKVK